MMYLSNPTYIRYNFGHYGGKMYKRSDNPFRNGNHKTTFFEHLKEIETIQDGSYNAFAKNSVHGTLGMNEHTYIPSV